MRRLYNCFWLALLSWLTFGCTDQCTETRTFRRYTPITLTTTQVRQGVSVSGARPLVKPGKIYTKDGYLFINELKEGVHIIDNRDPLSPKAVAFISIPGNGDIAIRDNLLYADSYMDLVTFDISNLAAIHEVARVQNVFSQGQFDGGWWYYPNTTTNTLISDQRVDYVTETVKTNCEAAPLRATTWWADVFYSVAGSSQQTQTSGSGSGDGTSGSMARFALYDAYLYAVNTAELKLFNLSQPASPTLTKTIPMGWGIETIFPYKDKLFIGSQTGMLIYDNADPIQPKQVSVFQHARVCDPVVVSGNLAYVTLRSGTSCTGTLNELDVVDVSNLVNPKLLKSYPMRNPYGLGVDFPNLFVCEGDYGLKSFNASDPLQIDKNLQQYMADLQAYDVIPLGMVSGQKILLLIGRDGFYQFDYSNPAKLRLLSKIPVSNPALT